MLEKADEGAPYYLDYFAIFRKYQNKGYGKQLLLWGMHHIRKNNNDPIFLHVADWNQNALKLYQKVGFEITHTERIR